MASELPEQWYEDAITALNRGYEDLFTSTNNQLGMPDHLRGVAWQFGEAKRLIEKLEAYALQTARGWEGDIAGNSNNAMNRGGRRRGRKSRRGRKTQRKN